MTTTAASDRRRKRRVAADEAHAWARNLRLHNAQAKLILSMLTLYVDGDGYCFVGIPQLAQDTELSEQTVRRRLVWLEEVGVIVRFPQWIDEKGRRNGDGKGKRTSDLIKLQIEADEDDIEARTLGRSVAADDDSPGHQQGLNPDRAGADDAETSFSPASQIGLNPASQPISPGHQQGLNSASPTAAVPQPSHCGKGLISEPEPEFSPQLPSGERLDHHDDQETEGQQEPEHFAYFKSNYPDRERWAWLKVLPVFAAMPPREQALAAAASPEYAKKLAATKPKPAPVRPERFLKDRIFDNFPQARLPEKAREPVWITEAETAALTVVYRILDLPPPRLIDDPQRGRGLWRAIPIDADLAAMARFATDDIGNWPTAPTDSNAFNAWRARLHAWTGLWAEPRKRWLEPFDPAVHGLSPSHADFRMRRSEQGLPVPIPWPPRKDGTISPTTGGTE